MGTMPATTLRAVGPRFEADNQMQLHDFQYAVWMTHRDRSPRRRLSQKLRMFHGQDPTVRQMNLERLEGASLVHLPQLFNGHACILLASRPRTMMRRKKCPQRMPTVFPCRLNTPP